MVPLFPCYLIEECRAGRNPALRARCRRLAGPSGDRQRAEPGPEGLVTRGRLEVGASTLDGKWLDGNWYNAWGVDFAYLRGAPSGARRIPPDDHQMPNSNADNRQGWYVQLGYFLNQVPMPFAPEVVQDFVHRLEPLVRYSGVNQRAIVQDEISTVPGIGFSGSPSIWTPHPREVALGLDYWVAPSIVWQNEVDLELPEAGRSIIAFAGGGYLVGNALQNNEIRESHTEGRLAYQQREIERQRREISQLRQEHESD